MTRFRVVASCALAILVIAGGLQGAQFTWTGAAGTDEFGNPANWNPIGVPNTGDDVLLPPLDPSLSTVRDDLNDFRVFNSWTVTGNYVVRGSAAIRINQMFHVADGATANLLYGTSIIFTAQPLLYSAGVFRQVGDETLGNITNASPSYLTLSTPGSGSIDVDYVTQGDLFKQGPGFARVGMSGGDSLIVFEGTMAASGRRQTGLDSMNLSVTVHPGARFCRGRSLNAVFVKPGGLLDIGCPDDPAARTVSTKTMTLQSSAQAIFDLFPSGSDVVEYRASVDLGGADVVVRPQFVPASGTAIDLIASDPNFGNAGVINGTFTGLPEGSEFTDGGVRYRITYRGGTYANNVQLLVVDSPAFSISDVVVNEDAGQAAFTVTMSPPSLLPLSVNYATAARTAHATEDYGALNGTLAFAPGETTKSLTVPIINDSIEEPTEVFYVNLSGNTGGQIARNTGTAEIVDDDCGPPAITEQPRAQTTVMPGDLVTLRVLATGSDPLRYQWYTGSPGDTSKPVENAMGSAMTIRAQATSTYWVSVSNACGSRASDVARILVSGRRRATRSR